MSIKPNQRLIEEIRVRNLFRREKQKKNRELGLSGHALERKRNKPSPIQDVETLLKIIDQTQGATK